MTSAFQSFFILFEGMNCKDKKDPLNTCQYAVQFRDLDEIPDCDLESGKFGTTLHLPRDFCVKDDSGFEDTLNMKRGGRCRCFLLDSANHI